MALFDNELRKAAKRANQRMRELESRGTRSPALQGVQARLTAIGQKPTRSGARRFSETGKFKNENEKRQFEKLVKDFLESKTSTVKGVKEYRRDVLESAQQKYVYTGAGLSDEDYLAIWDALPDEEIDRVFGSEQIIALVETATEKQGRRQNDNEMSVSEMIEKIQNASSLSNALDSLGITLPEFVETLGDL